KRIRHREHHRLQRGECPGGFGRERRGRASAGHTEVAGGIRGKAADRGSGAEDVELVPRYEIDGDGGNWSSTGECRTHKRQGRHDKPRSMSSDHLHLVTSYLLIA